MAQTGEFVEFVLEQLAPLGVVRARAMFGGHGIYLGAVIFAIIVDDALYFKADSITCARFAARGLKPFTYTARSKTITMQYYEAPPEVFEDPQAMRGWAQEAVEVALKAKTNRKSPNPALQGTRQKTARPFALSL